jgi:hypothetical protein
LVAPTATLDPCILEGEVVRLEPLRLAHVEALCTVGLDPELWRLTVSKVATPDDMRRYVEAPSPPSTRAPPSRSRRSGAPRVR